MDSLGGEAETAGRTLPLRVDLATPVLREARSGILSAALVYALLFLFFLGIAVLVGVAEGNWAGLTVLGAEFLVSACLFLGLHGVSFLRLRRRLGSGSLLTIDDRGLRWHDDGDRDARFGWDRLCGIGISYRFRDTKDGPVRSGHQLELFLRDPAPPVPAMRTFLRTEAPPRPGLPEARFRLLLSRGQDREIERAVRDRHPQLWLGRYRRRRRDIPRIVS